MILNGLYLYVRFSAHIINFIVKDGLDVVKTSIDSACNVIKYVRSSYQGYKNSKHVLMLGNLIKCIYGVRYVELVEFNILDVEIHIKIWKGIWQHERWRYALSWLVQKWWRRWEQKQMARQLEDLDSVRILVKFLSICFMMFHWDSVALRITLTKCGKLIFIRGCLMIMMMFC